LPDAPILAIGVPSSSLGNKKKNYSYFNAFNGSMFMARRAGMYDATKPTAASSKATEMRVTGSEGETPTNSDTMPRPGKEAQYQSSKQPRAHQHKALAQNHFQYVTRARRPAPCAPPIFMGFSAKAA